MYRLTGFVPFTARNVQEILEMNKKCELQYPKEIWDTVSKEGQDLVRKMLEISPDNRLTVKECLEHQWFKAYIPSEISLEHVVENLKKHCVE